jgi:Amt family ammonium transporter
MAGITGALLTGVFASKAVNPAGADGLLYGNPAQVGVQALAVLAAVAIAAVGTVVIYGVLRLAMPVRADVHEEIEGLDLAEHGEEAYFGGDVGAVAGPALALGHSVIVPASPAPARTASAVPATP